jgi:hypothetical protein
VSVFSVMPTRNLRLAICKPLDGKTLSSAAIARNNRFNE